MKYRIILSLLCLLAMPIAAQNVKELQKQQRELQQQLEETAKMLKQTKQNETATENKLSFIFGSNKSNNFHQTNPRQELI